MDLENQYYNSKALKEDDPKAALSSFQKVECYPVKCPVMSSFCLTYVFKKCILFLHVKVLELEGEKGEWGFKALKQMIKINFKLVSYTMDDVIHLSVPPVIV